MARNHPKADQYRGNGRGREQSLTTEEFAWLLRQSPSAEDVELFMATHTVGYDEHGRMVAVLRPFGE
jgi:hypothetical protein